MEAVTLLARHNPLAEDGHDHERPECPVDNDFNGLLGVRISAIFVVLIAGTFGSVFPVLASKHSGINIPNWMFFAAKYFGSGVIIATALIHLLEPANDSLSNECLNPKWQEYPYAYGICLFVIFVTFFVELVSQRYLSRAGIEHNHGPSGLDGEPVTAHGAAAAVDGIQPHGHAHSNDSAEQVAKDENVNADAVSRYSSDGGSMMSHNVVSQLGAIMFLEFGIIFHSVFVGLTLAVSGSEFKILYIVVVFHQLFEGLGLGTRIALAPWPSNKKWLPWLLSIAFGLTTPIAIAIGLGVRQSYPPGSATSLITNGLFDSISAGILLYSGLVELIANEFLHSKELKTASTPRVMSAFGIMCLGAGLMALLGRWG